MNTVESINSKPEEFYTPFELPSKGLGYAENLNIPAILHLRPIKVSEEKVVLADASANLNAVTTNILNRCTKETIDTGDLWMADRDYLMYQLRAISYSSTYPLRGRCKNCSSEVTSSVNLEDAEVISLESTDLLFPEVILPSSQYKFKLKPLTGKDMDFLIKKSRDKIESYIYNFSTCTTSIDVPGKPTVTLNSEIKAIINNLIGKDSYALRTAVSKNTFGIQKDYITSCGSCGADNTLTLELSDDFFRSED